MMGFVISRLKEKSTHGGLAMVAGGVLILIVSPLTTVIAYAAIAFGAYQIITKG